MTDFVPIHDWEKDALKQEVEEYHKLLPLKTKWLRFLLQTIVVLFGILVSMHKYRERADCIDFFFAIAVLFLGICILSVGVASFEEVHNKKVEMQILKRENRKAAKEGRTPIIQVFYPTRFFSVFEKIGYISFCLALIALVGYVLLPFFLK